MNNWIKRRAMTDAERQRRHRDRRRRDVLVVPVEVGLSTVEWLIESGRISELASRYPEDVGRAISAIIAERQLEEQH